MYIVGKYQSYLNKLEKQVENESLESFLYCFTGIANCIFTNNVRILCLSYIFQKIQNKYQIVIKRIEKERHSDHFQWYLLSRPR